MKILRKYEVQIYKLSHGHHEFEFTLDRDFFDLFENDIVNEGKLLAKVSLEKSDTMLQTSFKISGSVSLECDRSLDMFDFQIDLETAFIYKLGDETKELSDEAMVIPRDTQKLNVASIMFEFIGLEIPMKKLHPRFLIDDEASEDEEVILIYSSEEHEQASNDQDKEEMIDPRWASLKKLKNK
ncbi:MAG: hypothetical protein ACJAXX_000513 [Roseivirga sp.]